MANYRIGRKRRGVTWSNNVTEGNSRLVFKRDLEFAMDTQRVQKHAGRNCGNGLSIRYVAPREGLSYGFQLTHVGWYGKGKAPRLRLVQQWTSGGNWFVSFSRLLSLYKSGAKPNCPGRSPALTPSSSRTRSPIKGSSDCPSSGRRRD